MHAQPHLSNRKSDEISHESEESKNMQSKVPVQFTSQIRESKRRVQMSNFDLNILKLTPIHSDSYITCKMCENSTPTNQAASICPRAHLFCQDCLTQYSIYKINVTEEVVCPQEECYEKLSPSSRIFELLPQNIKERYKHQQLWRQTINNPNIKICPFEECSDGIVDLIKDPPQCRKCGRQYCKECMMQLHEGKPCDENFQGQFREWKRCPNCRMFIQKDGGCNHITCECGHEFCFVCLADWDSKHYDCLEGMENRLFFHDVDQIDKLPATFCFLALLPLFFLMLACMLIGAVVGFVFFFAIGALFSPCLAFKEFPKQCCLCWFILLPFIIVIGAIVIPIAFISTVYVPHCHRKLRQYCNSISFLKQAIVH